MTNDLARLTLQPTISTVILPKIFLGLVNKILIDVDGICTYPHDQLDHDISRRESDVVN